MINKDRILKEVEEYKEFLKESGNYKYTTIKGYSADFRGLLYEYPSVKAKDISQKQINDYLYKCVHAKGLARSSIQSMLSTFINIYNKIYDKGYYLSVKLPPAKFSKPEYIPQHDIFNFINNIENEKHKAIIALMYSCGLNAEELINIKIEDVSSKINKIFIKDDRGRVLRNPYLSSTMLKYLRAYYKLHKPKIYLFEGQKGGKYSKRSIQAFFRKCANKFGLHKDTTPFDLRHNYVKHMVLTGTPIPFILESMNIVSHQASREYARKIFGDNHINYSPFDRLVTKLDSRDEDVEKIEFTIKTLQSVDDREYLLEGLQCLNTGANRAAVIMIWNAGVRKIQRDLIDFDNNELNKTIKIYVPKAKKVNNIGDFQYIKESVQIEVANKLGLFDKFEKNILIENCLSLRNKCGHPTNYKPGLIRVTAFIEEMITICFIK